MKINHSIQVDLVNPGLPHRLQATQDDSCSHVLTLHLKENAKAWPIPADATVLVHFRKSDRTGGVYDTLPDGSAAWQVKGNALHIALAPQVLTAPGDTALAVTLVRGDSRLTVARILLQVSPCPGFAGVSDSYSYVSAFLPQPTTAVPGQLLQVKEVNDLGVVLSTQAVSGAGIGGAAGNALLSLLQKAVYTEDVTELLAVLEQQLDNETPAPAVTLVAIDAVYTGGAVYAGSDVKMLQGVTVTAHYSDGTRLQVKNFTLSGVIYSGENTITVSYGGCTDTITVVGQTRPTGEYAIYNNLTCATNSNPATTIEPGATYSCVIRPDSGYDLQRVMITMGEEVVFEENYTTPPLECGWTMKNVTGDIVITAIAQPQVTIANLAVTYAGGEVPAGTKLSALKGITVTVIYTDGTQQVLQGGYGLYGTIGVGESTVTVSYGGHTANFTVIGYSTASGYNLLYSWDLTESLVDSVSGVSALTNATQDTGGVHMDAADQYISLLPMHCSVLNKAVEIDIAPGTVTTPTGQHGRIFAVASGQYESCVFASCFTWRYNNDIGWASYSGDAQGSGWDTSLSSSTYPPNFFCGKTLRLQFDDQAFLTVSYAELGSQNFTTLHTWSLPWGYTSGHFLIGSSRDNQLFPITFTGVRIYEEV